jgi:hypothetical protein
MEPSVLKHSKKICVGAAKMLPIALLAIAGVGSACGGAFGPVEAEPSPAGGAAGAVLVAGASGAGGGGASGAAGSATMSSLGGSAGVGGSADAGGAESGGAAGASTSGSSGAMSAAGAAGHPAPPKICDAITEVFQVACGGGSCHTNPGALIGDWGISLDEAKTYVDRVSVRDAACGKIIDSSDYSKSFILVKLQGAVPNGCGGPMPVGSFGDLTQEQIDCVASWLQQFQKPL